MDSFFENLQDEGKVYHKEKQVWVDITGVSYSKSYPYNYSISWHYDCDGNGVRGCTNVMDEADFLTVFDIGNE